MKGQKKVRKVMREFKKGKLTSGNSKKKVKNRKQAIAIALSEAGISKKRKKMKKLKPLPKGKKSKGLRKLPKQVRNKMGYMKKGGRLVMAKLCPEGKAAASESSKFTLLHMLIFGHPNIAKGQSG